MAGGGRKSHINVCSSLLSVAVVKTNLERKGFLSSYRLQSITTAEAHAGTRRNVANWLASSALSFLIEPRHTCLG